MERDRLVSILAEEMRARYYASSGEGAARWMEMAEWTVSMIEEEAARISRVSVADLAAHKARGVADAIGDAVGGVWRAAFPER